MHVVVSQSLRQCINLTTAYHIQLFGLKRYAFCFAAFFGLKAIVASTAVFQPA